MESSFLPKTRRSKFFSRHIIESPVPSEQGNYNKKGFYYIGKNPANIEKLVKAFKRGYASELIENAKAELKRCLAQEKNTIPEVIFCESTFGFAAIKNFYGFLATHPILSSIPFILDSAGVGEKELHNFKKHKMADDIIHLIHTDEKTLTIKTEFLKKVKTKVIDLQSVPPEMTLSLPSLNIPIAFKRLFDIVVSSIALCVLSPIFLLIAAAIRLESRGPVFYIAKRAGRGYRIFDFYKFRTMFTGADQQIHQFSHLNQYAAGAEDAPVFFKINNDPRVTKVGAFLRNSSLDELPQLINVLLGDMSLVGNRPLPLYEAATLTTDESAKRFLAPAGITGLWQIKKRGKEDMSVEERIMLDIDYANKYNFMYDLWIMANTPSALIQKSNA